MEVEQFPLFPTESVCDPSVSLLPAKAALLAFLVIRDTLFFYISVAEAKYLAIIIIK